MLHKKTKRIIDLIIALLALIVLSPVLIILSLIIKMSMGGRVLFIQSRPGRDCKIFRMYKFRTMIPEDPLVPRTVEERITKLGVWMRATSLDELPELFNVIKGEMSLIGPRPLLIEYLENYTLTQMRRHEVLPGITGLAQVRGRNDLSWRNKFRYDVFYVDKANLQLDLRVLYETVYIVLFRTGFRSYGEPMKFGEEK